MFSYPNFSGFRLFNPYLKKNLTIYTFITSRKNILKSVKLQGVILEWIQE